MNGRWTCRALCITLAMTSAIAAFAQRGPIDPKELEIFMDGVIHTSMEGSHIPGAVLVVVQDGKVLLNKGYGLADVEKKTPIDPATTLFQIASVSKLFTATAAMQLVEQGKVTLDDDVFTLLKDWKDDGKRIRPLTLRNLMTHTGGFDERGIGMTTHTREEIQPLGPYLSKRLPPQVRPPNDISAYSNAGVALTGYLVESISGEPFNDYIKKHIFDPLGMANSSFLLTKEMEPNLATGYKYGGGEYKPVGTYFLNDGPAGSMVSTANDMARFMIAHLQYGQFESATILKPETVTLMHTTQYQAHPELGGLACQFFANTTNGVRTLSHGGDLPGFASFLLLAPEYNTGFFMSCNNDTDELRHDIIRQFMDRYFPVLEAPPAPIVSDDFMERAQRYAGTYRAARFSSQSLEKLSFLMGQLKVGVREPGKLNIYANDVHVLEELSPGLFRATDEPNSRYYFEPRPEGERDRLHMGAWSMERVRWYERTDLNGLFIFACVAIFGSVIVSWPIIWLVRRRRNTSPQISTYLRLAYFNCIFVSATYLVMLFGLVTSLSSDTDAFMYGMPWSVIILLCLPFLSLASVGSITLTLPVVWYRKVWSLTERIQFTAATALCWGMFGFMSIWNLWGFRW